MSDILFPISGGGGGGNLDEITASAEYVKSPYTFMNSEGDIEEGTMVDRENWGAAVGMNDHVTVPEGYHDGSGEVYGPTVTQRGAWTSRLGINGKVMIPEGYHNGNGYVDQDISTLGEQKVVPKLSRHTLWTANQYMTGNVIIEPIPNQKTAATKALSNGVNQQGLYFYIPEGYYLPDGTGNSWVYQTLAEVAKALGITADRVKKGVALCGVMGTFEGYVAKETVIYSKDLSQNSGNIDGFSIPDKCGISGGSLWWNTSAVIKTNKEYNLGQYDTLRVYCNIDPAYSSVNCSFGIYYYDDPKDSTPTVRATFQSGDVYPTTPNLTYYDISLSKVTMKGKLYISGNPGLRVMYWTLIKK